MTPPHNGYWFRHVDPRCHVAVESMVCGCDCPQDCQKLRELLAFFAYLGEPEPLLMTP